MVPRQHSKAIFPQKHASPASFVPFPGHFHHPSGNTGGVRESIDAQLYPGTAEFYGSEIPLGCNRSDRDPTGHPRIVLVYVDIIIIIAVMIIITPCCCNDVNSTSIIVCDHSARINLVCMYVCNVLHSLSRCPRYGIRRLWISHDFPASLWFQ